MSGDYGSQALEDYTIKQTAHFLQHAELYSMVSGTCECIKL